MISDCRVAVRFTHEKKPVALTGLMELAFKRKDITAVRFELLDSLPILWGELVHGGPYNITAIDTDSASSYMWMGARFDVVKINRLTGMVEAALGSWERFFYLAG